MNEWELCTPDSELVIASTVADAITKGLVREAVFNNNGAIKLELFEKYRKKQNYNKPETRFKRQVFDNQIDAETWLTQEGFPL